MKRLLSATTLAAILLAAVPFSALAAEEDSGWQFDLAPLYLWATTISGEVGMGPATGEIEADFGDITDNLDAVFTTHFEARKGAWGGLFDVVYMDVGSGTDLPGGARIDGSLQSTILEMSGLYRVDRGPHAFDAIAGVRYSSQKTEISLSPAGREGSVEEDWWDPIIGARWTWGFADRWSLGARGDIGGFGVGTEFQWNAAALMMWQPWKHVALAAGYRVLDQDYEEGKGMDRYVFDATIHGPLLGIDIRW